MKKAVLSPTSGRRRRLALLSAKPHRQQKLRRRSSGLVCWLIALAILYAPLRVEAQWTVFDPANYSLQVAKRIEEANRWLQQLQKWQEDADRWIEQLSRLRGIFQEAEKLVLRNKQNAYELMLWGRNIRNILILRRQIENMIHARIQLVESLRVRIRDQFFDPNAFWQEFEDYIKYSLGTQIEASFDNLQRIAEMDPEYDALVADYKETVAQINACYKEIADLQRALGEVEPDPTTGQPPEAKIQEMLRRVAELNQQLIQLKQRKSDLETKIEEKIKKYGYDLRGSATFGEQINEMFKYTTQAQIFNQQLIDQLNKEFYDDQLDDLGIFGIQPYYGNIYLDPPDEEFSP